jgi:hypothetical protein
MSSGAYDDWCPGIRLEQCLNVLIGDGSFLVEDDSVSLSDEFSLVRRFAPKVLPLALIVVCASISKFTLPHCTTGTRTMSLISDCGNLNPGKEYQ